MSDDYFEEARPDVRALVGARGMRVLDVGCGAGALGMGLKEDGATFVAGIELNPGAAARARERLDALVEGSVVDCDLPGEPGGFDRIVFADVLEHIPDPEAVLHRVLPLLAADGRVVISVPNYRFYAILLRLIFDRWEYADAGIRDRTHLRIVTRRSLERMIRDQGFEVENLERRPRLFEDQSRIGRLGAAATRLSNSTLARLMPDLMAFQFLVVARRSAAPRK